jgi:hypothetical protein
MAARFSSASASPKSAPAARATEHLDDAHLVGQLEGEVHQRGGRVDVSGDVAWG